MAGDEVGNGDGGKSDGDGDKVGGQATASMMPSRAMARATVTRWRGPPRRQFFSYSIGKYFTAQTCNSITFSQAQNIRLPSSLNIREDYNLLVT